MINLIPPKGKKAVKREYWVRVLSVWALLLSGTAVAAALLLAPAYVLISLQLRSVSGDIQKVSGTEESYSAAEGEVESANNVISQLSSPSPETNLIDLVRVVGDLADSGIQLRRFEMTRQDLEVSSFQIQGTAKTREALAAFKSSLEQSPRFATVVLPISDLANDVNLPFAITITLASSKPSKATKASKTSS